MWWKFWKAKEKPGLEVKFKKGEQLPWKNIWFKISEVKKDRIELEPISTTARFQKSKEV
jgi:hypothetical protein